MRRALPQILSFVLLLLSGSVAPATQWFPEELRSKQPSVFSVLRALIELFRAADDEHLGFYGAFGYELAFQFEPVKPRLVYDPNHPDAREDGYVVYPDINVVTEMVDMIASSRAYEANATVLSAAKDMINRSLQI